jgi:hypothetical protein
MVERRNSYRASVWKPERERERERERDTPLEDLGVNLTVILKLIFKKEDGIA